MKPNSLELDLRSRINSYSKINKNPLGKLGENEIFLFLNANYLSKLNLNYKNREDNEGIILLTRLT